MLEKIKKYSAILLKKLKKLIPILRSSEVESVFKRFYDWVASKNPDIDDVLNMISSFFMFLVSICLLGVVIMIYLIIGG